MQKIAVLVPCYNEEKTVKKVVKDFRKSLPEATVYVFDNNSSDGTAQLAREAGATVRTVKLAGKGNVVRRMFADIDADIYIMVDGDDTYDASVAPVLIKDLIDNNLDMVVGCRQEDSKENNNYRPGHRMGNLLLTTAVQKMFNGSFTDMLSGYRVFSRRFAKSFPAESSGFETETELTVFTLQQKLPYGEVMTKYTERPEGSESKLSTIKDGIKILSMIIRLYSNEKPLRFWSVIGFMLWVISLVLAVPVFIEYLDTDEVLRFPTLIVASGLFVSGFMAFIVGFILRTVTLGRRESKHLAYLTQPQVYNEPTKEA